MARTDAKREVVIVGLGWTGAIAGIELAKEGLDILALERGQDRSTVPDFKYPEVIDELRFGIRYGFMQRPKASTLTIRRSLDEEAMPYRRLGSFLPGDGVGGAGIHWNGQTWRPQAQEYRLRSYVEETFGADIIPEDMTIQDWGVTAEELEPFYDRFENMAGISGQAGHVNGETIEGGNPFEPSRSRDYPLPPLKQQPDSLHFADVARQMGYHPFPRPAANASAPHVNEYGMQLGPCNYCGFCARYGCLNYSKSSPQTCILDALKRYENFNYRVNSEVLRVNLAEDGQTATGVTYWDAEAEEEVTQPADIVILAAYAIHNVHLMLLSGIGEPYDPRTGTGTTGKNYSYQMNGGTTMFFADRQFNPFVSAGSSGMSINDFGMEQIDYAAEGFIGGSYMTCGHSNGQPIRGIAVPEGTPSWGAGWKQAVGEHYGHSTAVGSHGSNMAYRDCYLDLDPTYTDPHGRPLLRMTFNWKDNDIRMTQFMRQRIEEIVRAMEPDSWQSSYKDDGAIYDVRPYQTTHNVGGAIMGETPQTSSINRFQQTWGQHNVFVLGASAFPQNIQYNPTGAVGALAYWTTDAIVNDYLPNPRPLV